MTKVLVYGIDGAPPELIFEKWLDDLPNIKKLMSKGIHARLNSTIPPATVIAWSAFASGKDPSEIGIFSYTFRDQKTKKTHLVNSTHVKTEMIWDILGKNNKKSIVLNVPLTFPVRKINGIMISGFMAPDINSECIYPKRLKEKLEKLSKPELYFDITGFTGYKSLEIPEILDRSYKMTDMQIEILKDLIVNEEWDFLMQVFIGSDRLQHMLWRHFDNNHRNFIENSPYKNSLKEYYIYLDKKLGEILELLEKEEELVVIVSSDHGMIKQEGKININNWLIENKYLVLTEEFKKEIEENKKKDKRTRLKYEGIDMNKTIAYGAGAYNARIFINRKKTGEKYEEIRNEIIEGLMKIKDDKNNEIKTEIFKSEDIYSDPSSPECPDLTVYFDELRWASNPDFGVDGLYSWKTAAGADNAGHSKQGSFIIAGNGISLKGKIKDIDIYQITPTILKLMNIQIPESIKHKPIEVK